MTTIDITGDAYRVTRLDAHPEVATAAFRLEKVGREGVSYDVRIVPEGWLECDCPGHTYHGHCKHTAAVVGMMLDELAEAA